MEKKKTKSKWKLMCLLLVTMMLFVAGCGGEKQKSTSTGEKPQSAEGETIKIGFVLSFTGPLAPLSDSIKEGFELYLEEHGGKLGGKNVELKFEDDEGNPQVGLRKYRQLVHSEKVDLLVGTTNSSIALALRDEVNKDQIPMIIPNAAADDLNWGKKSDYVYRVSWSNWQNGYALGEYVAENVGKKAVIMGSDFPAGIEVLRSFKAAYEEAGGEVIKELYPKLGTNDFSTYLQEASSLEPDVIYSFFAGSDGIRYIQQYKEFGLKDKIPMSGTLEFGDLLMLEPTGDGSEGYLAGTVYSPWLENDLNKKFVEAYEKKYGKLPNTFSVNGYDSATVIDKALDAAGSVEAEKLIKELPGISYDSPRGPSTIDEKTHNIIQNIYITKNVMKDGKLVPEVIETKEKVTMPETSPFE
ncbi:ABC transporter substrate-binding protein [Bacillus timonensis]|uniref:ABC transporter substrate-binding protein n=1 Tax=Bacillus timonensis TaxID=1033734 RepID=A0A4S3PXK0_9BACI|nr:ABC transporter substrate-binding protein [Bacillus timonensis]THE14216.1 ABC transporter substrate-binding protein [Bacillus timonensis]